MFSRMTAGRFEKEKEECKIGPGSYELPATTLDEHGVTISGLERFQEGAAADTPGPGFYANVEDAKEAKNITRTPSKKRIGLQPSTKENMNCMTPRRKVGGISAEAKELEQLKKQLTNEEKLRHAAEAKANDLAQAKKWATEAQVQINSKDRKIEDMQRRIEEANAKGAESQRKLREIEAEEGGRRKAQHEKEQATVNLQRSLEQQESLCNKLKEQLDKAEEHEKELQMKCAAAEKAAADAKEESAATIQSLTSKEAESKQLTEKAHKERIDKLSEVHASEKQSLEKAHADKVEKLAAAHASEKQALEKAQADTCAAGNQHVEETTRLKQQHADAIAALESKCKDLRDEALKEKEEHAEALKQKDAAVADDKKTLVESHAQEMKKASESHAKVLEDLDSLKNEHDGVVEALREEVQGLKDQSIQDKEEHAVAMEKLTATCGKDLDSLKNEHDGVVEALRKEVQGLKDQSIQDKEEHAVAMEKLTATGTGEKQHLQESHAAVVSEIKAAHAAEKQDLESAKSTELELLRTQHDVEKQQLVEASTAELSLLQQTHADEKTELEAAKAADLEVLQDQHVDEVASLQKAHCAAVEDMKHQHSSTVQELREEVKSYKASNHQMQQETERLQILLDDEHEQNQHALATERLEKDALLKEKNQERAMLSDEIEKLQKQLEEKADCDEAEDLKAQLFNTQLEVTGALAQASEAKTALDSSEKTLAETEEKLESLRSEISQEKKAKLAIEKNNRAELAELQESNKKLQADLDKLQFTEKRAQMFESSKKKAEQQVKELKVEVEQQKQRMAAMEVDGEKLRRLEEDACLRDRENKETHEQNTDLLQSLRHLEQDWEQSEITNKSLQESLAEYEADLALTKDENSALVGHNNHKQKVKYHMKMKEENDQLKHKVNDLQHKLSQFEAGQRGSSLLAALAAFGGGQNNSIGEISVCGQPVYSTAGREPSTPNPKGSTSTCRSRRRPNSGTRTPRGAACLEADCARCAIQERAAERTIVDFQHFLTLIERAAFVGDIGGGDITEPTAMLAKLRDVVASGSHVKAAPQTRQGEVDEDGSAVPEANRL